jgi:GrpB-like predicted nucleotidyltransferase (UPF0157 family)
LASYPDNRPQQVRFQDKFLGRLDALGFKGTMVMKLDTLDVDEPIVIVDYDPESPSLFTFECDRVEAALGDVATRIKHQGNPI